MNLRGREYKNSKKAPAGPIGVRFFGTSLVVFGVYSLIGIGRYSQFAVVFKGIPATGIMVIYWFTVLYGICCVYCGLRIRHFENWARQVMLVMISISVLSGFFLNRIAMSNFKDIIAAGKAGFPVDMTGTVYSYMIIFTAIITLYELSVIYYLTRSSVAGSFE